ncbi:MAG TPA: aromatic ring-hydroxylating dioxygenase subunit alpha [Chloroflexota bacterium]
MRSDSPTASTSELAESLEQGYTLPSTWYTDDAFFAREQQHIFRHCWQYAGLKEQVRHAGNFFTCVAGDVPIVIVRDEEGRLRAFANVCRHRGSTLVLEPCGTRRSIQCHYHAWTYGLNGALRAAPGSKLEPDFDKEQFSLVPVQVDTWGPFVFVNPDVHAKPLASTLGELPRLVAETGIDLDAIRCRKRDTYDIAANWKVVVDNYLECYHCPVAHPAFSDLIDLDQYVVTEYDLFSIQTGPVKQSARGGRGTLYAIGEGVEAGFYAYLWPNFMLNIYPGPGNVSLNLIMPAGTHATRAIYEYCFVDAIGDDEVRDFTQFVDQVQREDIVLCESVQRGLRSGFLDQGKLMLSRERALQHFQKLVYRAVAEPTAEPPA